MDAPRIDEQTYLLVMTGAGVSAESGIPTFRGAGGLWENHSFETLASPEGFARDPALVWRFYSHRRKVATTCRPNPGHLALAAVERRLGDRFLLVTQNVDGLHREAGSQRLVELHGNLFTTRCDGCARAPFADRALHEAEVPTCDCGSRLRPHIVWFGEALDAGHFARIEAFFARARGGRLVFLAAGTSGVVYPAAGLVEVARALGARTWLVNAEPPRNAHHFEHFVQGNSGQVLPALLGEVPTA
jgi:NAD-dependent deacetylase